MYFVNSVSLHAFHLINLLKYLLEGIGIIGLSYDHCIWFIYALYIRGFQLGVNRSNLWGFAKQCMKTLESKFVYVLVLKMYINFDL